MDSVTNVALDTSEVRPARASAALKPTRAPARPRRLLLVGGATLGLVVLAGAGVGAYVVLGPEPGTKLASASFAAPRGIQFGPLAEMPDIRDGVPAIVRSAPVNLVERRVVEAAPVTVAATPQSSERDVAASFARRSAVPLADPSAEAANARAMASTVALRPSVVPVTRDASAPVRVIATQPVPSVSVAPPALSPAPVVASLEPSASPITVDAPFVSTRRDPEPVGSIQPAPAPVRPAANPAQIPRAATTETPPLPPVRRVSRTVEAPVQAQPAPRQPSTAARPVPAPVATPAPVVARAAPQPEDRPEIFGLPLPRFVPTGRQIRDAASSVADAVTSIPDVF